MATRYPGNRRERRALNTYIRLHRAVNAVGAQVLEHAPLPDNLTVPQFGVLEALLHLGPMCQAALGRKLLRTKGNVSLVVDNLASRDLVERRPSSADRRQIEVYLTEEGHRLISGYFPKHAEGIVKAMSVLSAEEQEQLGELCRRLGVAQEVPHRPRAPAPVASNRSGRE